MFSAEVPSDDKQRDTRKPYTKPLIENVLLVPEEAVLGGCKISGGSGFGGGDCTLPVNCVDIGIS